MKKIFISIIIFFLLCVSFNSYALSKKEGEILVKKYNCTFCHGLNFNNTIRLDYPKLSGQYFDYIYWSLRQYLIGSSNLYFGRINSIMNDQVRNLSDYDMKNIAMYISSINGDIY